MAICLNGTWYYGDHRGFLGECTVPGLVLDPAASQSVRLRRKVCLPAQPFTRLLLVLKGARFCPQVYVNGDLVSQSEGGMAFTRHLFSHPACVPGAEIELEIRLTALDDVPLWDASRIPEADHWRSNLSSCLWDDVLLYPVGDAAITRIVPHADVHGVNVQIDADAPCQMQVQLCDADDRVLVSVSHSAEKGTSSVYLPAALQPWSPEAPCVYHVTAKTEDGCSKMTVTCGLSDFRVQDRSFLLNDLPIRLRGTSVVWHRFCRDPEARTLAFDNAWFERNIVLRLKDAGANLLRFHLGLPMERMLELCDRHGLCVQLEWLFFHGMKAGEESLIRQWREVLTLAAAHPSVCIIHLWNETEGPDLVTAHSALNALHSEFPWAVISHRDVTHVHKYWWSLFENLNLSYDSADELPGAAMVDEFGGNYLDGQLMTGGYPETAESFERFLGRDHTAEERNELQMLANARVGEYWRRAGTAGCATFAALSSPEDGNHHFLGALKDGVPKGVWKACSALYAPKAASLELWDRSFEHGQTISASVWLFNDTHEAAELQWQTAVIDENVLETLSPVFRHTVDADSHVVVPVQLTTPAHGSRATLEVRLLEAPFPVSSWPVRLHSICLPASLRGLTFSMLSDEPELKAFAEYCGMRETSEQPHLLLGGHDALVRLHNDAAFRADIEKQVASGCGMLLDQIGPQLLGEGYLGDRSLVRLDGDTRLEHNQSWRYQLPFNYSMRFDAQAEAESCCHPPEGKTCFDGLQRGALQLSNGYRGGLTAPAASMEIEPSDTRSLLALWTQKGASEEMLLQHPECVAYQLEGFCAFAEQPSEQTALALRERVRFLADDAPSLQGRIQPEAPMEMIPVGRLLADAAKRPPAAMPEPLVVCGRGLARSAALAIEPQKNSGAMVLSQLLTRGRLVEGFGQDGLYGARRDPELIQLMTSLFLRALRL